MITRFENVMGCNCGFVDNSTLLFVTRVCPACGDKLWPLVGRRVLKYNGTWWKLWLDKKYNWELKKPKES